MRQEIIIGVSVALALVVIVVIHGWLHRLVKFKMDESAILNMLAESTSDNSIQSTDTISARTDLTRERVSAICARSKTIKRHPEEGNSWSLK